MGAQFWIGFAVGVFTLLGVLIALGAFSVSIGLSKDGVDVKKTHRPY